MGMEHIKDVVDGRGDKFVAFGKEQTVQTVANLRDVCHFYKVAMIVKDV